MSKIKVEKNIPIPKKPIYWKGILKTMEIGDSFFTTPRPNAHPTLNAAKALGIKITTRKEGDGVRVWRIE